MLTVTKLGRLFWYHACVDVCIVDECHLIMSRVLSQCLYGVEPRFLIGLSATPYRTDGLDPLLDAYFGPQRMSKEYLRQHTAVHVDTGIRIDAPVNPRTSRAGGTSATKPSRLLVANALVLAANVVLAGVAGAGTLRLAVGLAGAGADTGTGAGAGGGVGSSVNNRSAHFSYRSYFRTVWDGGAITTFNKALSLVLQ